MKNKLIDLNNLLFEALERLNEEDLTEDKLKVEVVRSKAMSDVASTIIDNARLALKGQMAINDGLIKRSPKMLGIVGPGEDED